MSLRKKTFLIFGITFIALIALLLALSGIILMRGFSQIEEKKTRDDLQRALDTIGDDSNNLNSRTRDWASWNDTYNFIADRNETYIASNLAEETSFTENQVNAMFFVNQSGETVYAQGYDLQQKKFVPVPAALQNMLKPGSILLNHPDKDASVQGIVMLPEGPMMIASLPIITSERQGPIRGSLIWGRYLDQAQIDRLSHITHLSLFISDLGNEAAPPELTSETASNDSQPVAVKSLSDDNISGLTILKDINGQPSLLLRTESPRDVYAKAKSTQWYLFFSLIFAGATLGSVSLLPLEFWVLSRISGLSRAVSNIASRADHSKRLKMQGRDELSNLTNNINNMLAALQQAQQALKQTNEELEDRVRARTQALQNKVSILEALAEIDQEIAAATYSSSIMELVCNRARELLSAPKAIISLLDSPEKMAVSASSGLKHPDLVKNYKFSVAPVRHEAQQGKPILVYEQLPEELINDCPFYAGEEVVTAAIASLIVKNRFLGTIQILDTSPHKWNADEIQAMELLAGQLAVALEDANLFEQQKAQKEDLATLFDVSSLLADTQPDFQKIMDMVSRHAVEKIHVTFACILFLDQSYRMVMRSIYPVRALGKDPSQIGQDIGFYPALMEILEKKIPMVLHQKDEAPAELASFLKVAKSLCVVPLHDEDRNLGLLVLGEERSEDREPFTPEKIHLAQSIADQTAVALRRAELFANLERAYLQTAMALGNAIDAKDTYTANHSLSLAKEALAIGRKMGLDSKQLNDLRFGAILHDVGKIGIPDNILKKPSRLSNEEWSYMKQHPAEGEKILNPVPYLKEAAKIIRHHHEWYDGSGYPDGLAGNQIPLGARILSVVDAYHAIIDKRVYKDENEQDTAVAEIKKFSGKQFDPEIVSIFLNMLTSGERPHEADKK